MDSLLNQYFREDTVVSGDIAQPMVKLGGVRKRLKEKSQKIETSKDAGHKHIIDLSSIDINNNNLVMSTSKDDGHTHKVILPPQLVDNLDSEESVEVDTIRDKTGHDHRVLLDLTKLDLGEKKMDIIKEGESFRFFIENQFKVFELLNESDHDLFAMGVRKANYRYWRQFPAGVALLTVMQEHRGKNLIVRYGDKECRPFALGM